MRRLITAVLTPLLVTACADRTPTDVPAPQLSAASVDREVIVFEDKLELPLPCGSGEVVTGPVQVRVRFNRTLTGNRFVARAQRILSGIGTGSSTGASYILRSIENNVATGSMDDGEVRAQTVAVARVIGEGSAPSFNQTFIITVTSVQGIPTGATVKVDRATCG